jgi:plasmid stabilization system protein ParE
MVAQIKRSILWDDEAKLYFKQAIQYIKQESPQGAVTVKRAIMDQIDILKNDPEIYELDRFKINNDGSYRAVTVYNYRITYIVTPTQIQILRVRHTSQNPINY